MKGKFHERKSPWKNYFYFYEQSPHESDWVYPCHTTWTVFLFTDARPLIRALYAIIICELGHYHVTHGVLTVMCFVESSMISWQLPLERSAKSTPLRHFFNAGEDGEMHLASCPITVSTQLLFMYAQPVFMLSCSHPLVLIVLCVCHAVCPSLIKQSVFSSKRMDCSWDNMHGKINKLCGNQTARLILSCAQCVCLWNIAEACRIMQHVFR